MVRWTRRERAALCLYMKLRATSWGSLRSCVICLLRAAVVLIRALLAVTCRSITQDLVLRKWECYIQSMAKKTFVELYDDVTGERIDTRIVSSPTISFAIDGVEYEIDLGAKNRDKLYAAFEPYIHAARKVGGRRRPAATSTTSSGLSKVEIMKIRDWAQTSGHKVSARGRLSKELVEAYRKQNA